MKLGLNLGYMGLGAPVTDQVELVQEAERLGFDSVWTAEAYGSDAATPLAWLAAQTSTIGLGSAILQIPGRSAGMTAMTAATLDHLSGGRFRLGLGTSGPQVSEGWHGVRFGRQLARTREYVDVVRMALRRERVVYHGSTLELPLPDGPGKALKLTIGPVQDAIPIYLAAIGPKNTALAAEIADGWLPVLVAPEHMAEFRPSLEAGFSAAGRSADGFDIAPTVSFLISDDLDAARDAMRGYVALYIGGMGSRDKNFYNRLVSSYGFADAARRGPGPVPGGPQGRGDGGAAGRADRRRRAVRSRRPRARAAGRLPRGGRRHADPLPGRLDARGPRGATAGDRRAGRLMRVLLGAFGDPGHAFPMLALGTRLAERGHLVCLQTWVKWQADVEAAGMTFAAAPEYQVFPTLGRPMKPYEAATAAARDTEPLVRDFRPDVCVADILTLAPAWAAELWDVPVATLVPHVCPLPSPGFPPYSLGARLPRTAAGARLWRLTDGLVRRGLETGRDDYNTARGRLGLPPRPELHTGLSRSLTLIGTLPHLEYPRAWPAWTRVVGPLLWEPPGELVDPPPGEGPVVLVAPSTAHDAEHTLLRAALDGLAQRAGAGDRDLERPPAAVAGRLPGPGQRRARAVAVVRALDARLRRRDLSRRARDAGAGADAGLRGRRLPGRRRHGRERGPRRLDGGGRAAAAAAARAGHDAARGPAGAGRSPAAQAGARDRDMVGDPRWRGDRRRGGRGVGRQLAIRGRGRPRPGRCGPPPAALGSAT